MVEECRADTDYSLWLVFDDGLEGRVYLGDLVGNLDFSAWSDIERFLEFLGIDTQAVARHPAAAQPLADNLCQLATLRIPN